MKLIILFAAFIALREVSSLYALCGVSARCVLGYLGGI